MKQQKIETIDTVFPITLENLPRGPLWDDDGACFEALPCDGCTGPIGDWWWSARNIKAFEKGKPDKAMYPFYPFVPLVTPSGGGFSSSVAAKSIMTFIHERIAATLRFDKLEGNSSAARPSGTGRVDLGMVVLTKGANFCIAAANGDFGAGA